MRSRRVAHERAEARLAAPGVDLLGQLRAAEREGDLRGEVAQRARSAVPSVSPVATSRTPRSCSRGVRPMARTWSCCAGARCRCAATRASASSGTAGSAPGRRAPRRSPAARWRQVSSSAAGPWAATIRSSPSSRSANALVGPGTARRPTAWPPRRARRARWRPRGRTRAAQHALASGGALLLADQAGHAGHDEDEQDDRREDDDEQVDVAAAHLADDLDGRCDERRERQERQADRRQARRVPGAGSESSRIDGCSAAAPQRR